MITQSSTRQPTHLSPWQPVGEIIRFELRDSLRGRFPVIAFGAFLIVGVLVMLGLGSDLLFFPAIRSAMGLTPRPGELAPYANAPLQIMRIFGVANLFLIVLAVGIFAERATKDFSSNMDGLLFTTPLKEWQFGVGRWIASFVICVFIASGLGLGLLVGQALPWMNPASIGAFGLLPFLQPYLYLVIPNLVIFGLLSFGAGLLTRRPLAGYLGFVVILILQFVLESLVSLFNAGGFLTVLVNPLGASAIEYVVQYWTKVEQNTLTVPFAPVIWASRLLYLAVSIIWMAWVWRQFSFSGQDSTPRWLERLLNWVERRMSRKKDGDSAAAAPTVQSPTAGVFKAGVTVPEIPAAHLDYGAGAQFGQVWRIAMFDLKRLIGNPLVLTILAISVIATGFLMTQVLSSGGGMPVLPTTEVVVDGLSLLLRFIAPLLIVFLVGDLVWRERDAQVDPLIDSLPTLSWVFVVGKWLAVALLLALTLVLLTVGALAAQTVSGYTHYNLGVYGIGLFTITLVDLLLIAVLALTIQVLVNQKLLGYFLSVLLVMLFLAGDAVPIFRNARLLQYGFRPQSYYSDISGYGSMLEPVRWFQAYWLAIAVFLLCVAALFWVRGVDTRFQQRWSIARQRLTRPMQAVMAVSAASALLLGGWIYYNTQVLNGGTSIAAAIPQLVAYEKAYGHLRDAQPKITEISLQGDLYPEEDSRFAVKGAYTLQNQTQAPIDTILINIPGSVQVNEVTVEGVAGQQGVQYPGMNVYAFPLSTPLEPGATIEANFDLVRRPPAGFQAGTGDFGGYLANGASFLSTDFLPQVGLARLLLTNPQTRDQEGLPPLDPAAEQARASQFNSNHPDTDLVQYSAILSTASDQIIFTSGEMVREWTEGNRRYFEYRSQTPVQKMVPFLSGRYEVLRDEWQGIPVEVYYHPGHAYNVEHILAGAKQGLDYAAQHFGPYPNKSLRIVETPYVSEALSHAGGQINMGEKLAFLTKVVDNDPTALNTAFRYAAHEVAHQWWGHQVHISPAVPGSQILTESLSEYTANQVYAREFGTTGLGMALRSNLNTYLQNRSQADTPLVETKMGANHLVYEKGGLVMYALQDYLGEDVVNRVLAQFVQDHATAPPYPTGKDLIAALRQATPEKYQYLITDLFETVTLYNNKAVSATVRQLADGQFEVSLTFLTEKVRSDAVGNETPVEMRDEEIDVGVYDAEGQLIYLMKHPFSGSQTTLTITVDTLPVAAGIDPLHKLIDKAPDDNRIAVTDAAD
ncbi:MAG: hypothetical protein BroJett021_26070 [Chloroflexota bacterium]|nr:MAG: hypothetical protein BroJett021_26070 [Chloroflexota bacterium]